MTLVAAVALAGAVLTVHGAISHDHMGDVIVTCLAVAETALVAVGAALGDCDQAAAVEIEGGDFLGSTHHCEMLPKRFQRPMMLPVSTPSRQQKTSP